MAAETALLGQSDVATHERGGFEVGQLEQLVVMSGVENLPIAARKYSVHRVIEHNGRTFKVRAFRSPGAAQRQLELIRRIPQLFPHCYGRIDRCLVWDYKQSAPLPTGRNIMTDIGGFMAEMSRVTTAPLPEQVFAGWCEDIHRTGIFFAKTLSFLKDYFAECRSRVPSWNIEYLDAVPKNFIYTDTGRFLCIDGKHLFPGPRGLGLIKLRCHIGFLISENDYMKVVSSYRQRVDFPEFDDPKYFDFLLFYYCMVLLADNAQFISRRCNLESARTRWRKRLLLQTVEVPRALCWMEKAVSGLTYYAFRMHTRIGELSRMIGRMAR